jgi:hypothetical protein
MKPNGTLAWTGAAWRLSIDAGAHYDLQTSQIRQLSRKDDPQAVILKTSLHIWMAISAQRVDPRPALLPPDFPAINVHVDSGWRGLVSIACTDVAIASSAIHAVRWPAQPRRPAREVVLPTDTKLYYFSGYSNGFYVPPQQESVVYQCISASGVRQNANGERTPFNVAQIVAVWHLP